MESTRKHLVVSVEGHTARVELDRPPVNALSREFVRELRSVALELGARKDIWLVVVTSTQKVFSAGADLKERAGIPDADVLALVKGIQDLTRVWGEMPQPVIMGIRGAALGGGLEFALTADILVASEGARLGLPEVGLGIIPAAGGTQRLTLRTSVGVARKWVLTAKQFTAQEALADGVVDFLVPEDRFDEELLHTVKQAENLAPLSMRQAKQVFIRANAQALADGFKNELEAYAPLIGSNDRREALKAFSEKRLPRWNGS
jgi:methylglutaconyl-CoA hydratase